LASVGLCWKRCTMAAGSMPACRVADIPCLTWSRSTFWMIDDRPWTHAASTHRSSTRVQQKPKTETTNSPRLCGYGGPRSRELASNMQKRHIPAAAAVMRRVHCVLSGRCAVPCREP
jgi:hypothetical protein